MHSQSLIVDDSLYLVQWYVFTWLGGQLSAVKWTGCQMSHGQLSGSQTCHGQMSWTLELACRQSSKNSIAVIQLCQNQRHHQCDEWFPADWTMDAVKLTQYSKTTRDNLGDVHWHWQTAVNPDSEVTHDWRWINRIATNKDWCDRQLMHPLMRAASQELCFGHVQLQAVCTHPFSYILHTGCHLLT